MYNNMASKYFKEVFHPGLNCLYYFQ